jgi:hypothetical protein
VKNYIEYFEKDKLRSDNDLNAAKLLLAPLNDAWVIAKAAQAVEQKKLDAETKALAALKVQRDMARPAITGGSPEPEIKAGYNTLLTEVAD